MASVARTRSNEADGAVQVLAVIPAGEGFHPGLSVCLCGKALGRPVRAIFAGSEERLGERIVIADARAAVGCGDAQFFHGGFHRSTFHRAAVVGVQNQWACDSSPSHDHLSDEDGC